MPKPSKKDSSEKDMESIKYRWEFLRLNKEYGEERLKVLQLEKKAREKYLVKSPRFNLEAYEKVLKEVNKFYEKWGVSLGCPAPEKNFEDISEGGRWSLFEKALNLDHRTIKIIVNNKNSQMYRTMFEGKKLTPLKVKINLNMPKTRILYELDDLIDTLQGLMTKKKPRIGDDHLIKVYKFVEKMRAKNKKVTFLEIAEKFYEGKRDIISREEEDLLGKNYRKAKKIVEGGYKYIW